MFSIIVAPVVAISTLVIELLAVGMAECVPLETVYDEPCVELTKFCDGSIGSNACDLLSEPWIDVSSGIAFVIFSTTAWEWLMNDVFWVAKEDKFHYQYYKLSLLFPNQV